ncbi:PfkB family carbohydrate kinase [Niveibacterium sp. SC-1]|uniref:carbohydrate kinase family protein n=1 Tax=Niveibacterium sp. SC-1 TaxID=3135646 RepID=UPI00311D50AE
MSSQEALDVYLFGMVVWSTLHRLAAPYPDPDHYAEIAESAQVPGGETGNGAIVLAHWGWRTRMDGPWLGTRTAAGVRACCARYGIDDRGLVDAPDFDGLEDLVLIDAQSRTVFGRFARYFDGHAQQWSEPDAAAIARARVVAIDPFFGASGERAATLCREAGKPYVTLDCLPDSLLHRHAAATVISAEFRRQHFPAADTAELLDAYARQAPGLCIFTAGAQPVHYARGTQRAAVPAPAIEPRSTLGAGDVFRAGVVHGLLAGFDDDKTVRFAAAAAACACLDFPIAEHPPALTRIHALMQ